MKSDSTKKSEIKITDKVKTSDKNNLKKDINQKTLLQKRVTEEKISNMNGIVLTLRNTLLILKRY